MRPDARRLCEDPIPRPQRGARSRRDLHAMLGRLAQAADDAHQPLRLERDGPPGAILSYEEHDGIPVQDRRLIGHRHQQERHDHPLRSEVKKIRALAVALFGASCTTLSGTTASTHATATPASWTDSVMASMT